MCHEGGNYDTESTSSRNAVKGDSTSSTTALGILAGVLAVTLLATVMAFGIILARLKRNSLSRHYDVPAERLAHTAESWTSVQLDDSL